MDAPSPPIYLILDLAVILLAAALVSWGCRRIGMSPIVGYLGAGLLIGSPEAVFVYTASPQRVQALSQIGLVFLMFSIGLGFRLQRFRQLGFGLIAATVFTALILLTATRFAAGWLGLDQGESLFFAAMLMVSSSVVVSRTLQSCSHTHRRFGQLALGVTLGEDIVAIVLLAFLGSYAAMEPGGAGNWANLLSKVGMLAAFVALLMVPSLIVMPRLLDRISALRENHQELETLIVAGAMFGMAFLTLYFGYSIALGAFLFGVVVAESRRRNALGETFSGLRDLFSAVFFVTIGMSISPASFPAAAELIVLGALLALLLRPLAATLGLMLGCEEARNATRAGLCLAPVGEFSFVIAGLGTTTGILSSRFETASVGIALVTALAAPLMMRRSETIAAIITPTRLPLLREAHSAYCKLWLLLGRRQGSNFLWRLLRPRIPQVAGELLLVSALLLFSHPIYQALRPVIDPETPLARASYQYGYWVGLTLLTLVPLVALARNINAIAMLMGEYCTQGLRSAPSARRASILLFRGIGLGCLALWVLNLIPFSWLSAYTLLGMVAAAALALLFGWRGMVRLHSEATFAMREAVNAASPVEAEVQALMKAKEDWGIHLEEWPLANSGLSGSSIGELQLRKRTGATIVGIERQGHFLRSVGPGTHVFLGDRLYVTGSESQLAALRELIAPSRRDETVASADYQEAALESGVVRRGSAAAGKSLRQLQWPRLLGAQVVALRRDGQSPAAPEADLVLQPGDALLLVGSPRALAEAIALLEPPLEPSDPSEPRS